VLRAALRLGATGLGPDDFGPAGRLLATSAPAAGLSRRPTGATDSPDPADARFQLLDAVAQVLGRLAADAPLVVALDDLHWADEPSLHLLDFVASRLRAEAVMLLGAYRDAEAGPALRAVVGGAQQLPLVGLTSRDIRTLMVSVAGTHDLAPPPDSLADEIWRRSGGNPFFARELTRLVLAQGGWGSGQAQGRAMLDSGSVVPDTVRDTLERRLARLSQPCAEMLTVAAVAGTELREEVLARVVPGDGARPSLAELLAEAARARVLVPPVDPLGHYHFVHGLYRETIQAGLNSAERRSLHLAVGRALEELRAEGADVHLAELAAHLLASGTDEALADAVSFSAAAAGEAMARLGYEDARRHYGRALAAWERVGGEPTQRVELLLGLADARYRAGDGEGARADLHRTAELARRIGDPAGLARAAVALHDLGTRGPSPESTAIVELLTAAADALPAEPSTLRALVLTALVRSMRHQPPGQDQDPIVAAGREAVRVARVVADPSALAFALLALHDALWQPGTGAQRLAVLDEMGEAAAVADERDLLAQTHQLRAAALLESGDPRGRTELARYIELMAGSGHARGRWEAMTRRATLAVIGGRWGEADRLAADAREFGRTTGEPDAEGVHGTLRGALLVFGAIEGGFDLSPDQLDHSAPALSYLPALRALPLIAQGDLTAARQALSGLAVQEVEAGYHLEPLALLAAVIAPAGSDQQRRQVYERLEPYAGLHAVVGGCASYWGAVDHHLGQLAAALGWHSEAVAHLESALAAYERLGAPAWAEHCRERLDEIRGEVEPAEPDGGADRPAFRFDGGSWELEYRGKQVHLPDAKGLRDIAVLISSPGRPVHVLRLLGADEPSGADPLLDERARKAYRARLNDLDGEIEQARGWQDPIRAERAAIERDALIRELTAAAGLGGRARLLGDRSERARKTVTARIRHALRRIDLAHPELARHLRSTITTGTECGYAPEHPMNRQE
jgi:hypothetical protein